MGKKKKGGKKKAIKKTENKAMTRELALTMVRQAFEHGVKVGEISRNTANTYCERVQNFVNNHLPKIKAAGGDAKSRDAFNPKFWKGAWVDGWFEKLIERYHEGAVSASYIVNSAHAFGKLQDLVKKHQAISGLESVRVGEKGSIEAENGRLYRLYEEGIGMTQDEVTSIKGTPDDFERLLKHLQIPRDHPNYRSVLNILIAQRQTGGRITAECNLKVRDIEFKNGTKRYDKDKNDFTRRVPLEPSQIQFYKQLTKGKDPGTSLFPLFRENGTQMTKKEASLYMQKIVGEASKAAGFTILDENGKVVERYTSHTSRRIRASEWYAQTRWMKKEEIWKHIKDYVNLQGSNKEGIWARIQAEKKRLNYYRIKNGLPMKEFSWETLRRLYISLRLGHSRTDFLKRYIDIDKETRGRGN